ncbi:MAG: RagB/SusD family nutrient uptake outer membrane protein [Ferruginibacter sp.]
MNTKFAKQLTLISLLVISIGAGSCKKYLDQQPITDLSTEVVFNDVPSTYKAIAGVYSRLVGDAGFGIRLSLYYTVDNDEMQGPTGAGDNDRRDIARYAATSGNAQITNPFNQLFQGIEFANICIANIPGMDMYSNGTDQQKKQLRRMYGEALTLRAQFYLEAIMNWGDLPAHFEPAAVTIVTNPFPVRVNRDSLYDRLLRDLLTAEDLVPWRNELAAIGDPVDERITKGTVKALRARIALFRGGYSLRQTGGMQRSADYATYYQIARDECSSIISSGQHGLNASYKALWKDQVCAHAVADPDGELMFQASASGLTGVEDTKLGYYNGPTVNNLGNKSINVLPSYFYLFDSTDLRRDVTCAPYNVAANGSTKIAQVITAICDGKYRRDWVTNPVISPTSQVQYLGLKWQIIRYSDVLLMFAEADNEVNGGPTAAAYNAVNMVRRRGYGKPVNTPDATVDLPAGLGKTAFFQAIVRERALELGGEGVRKFDLIRWNLLATALSESKANMTRMSSSTAMVNPTYMAAYPAYCLTTSLPVSMYYYSSTTSDNNNIGGLFANSLYKTAPTATPSGTTKITWLSSAIATAGTTSPVGRYATGFVTGKGELLPIPQPARDANYNLTQNPNY